MKILHILDHSIPLHSGYTFRTRAILEQQRALGWETAHLTSSKHTAPGPDVETVDGLTFYRTPAPGGLLARLPVLNQWAIVGALARRLEQVVERERPDILHAHSPSLNGLAALGVARRRGLPLVYECRAFWEDAAVDHGTSREWGMRYRLTRALETHVFRRADAVTTICQGLKQEIAGRGIDAAKITVIPNAVDLDRFDPIERKDPELERRLGLEGETVLGFLGSFYAYEGLALLIESLPAILQRRPSTRLLLVGGGPEEQALRRQVSDLGLGERVIFTGRVPHDQVSRYYSLVDILVYPRLPMRLTDLVTPLKPLEAMAQGKLVVASDVGGHRELIRDGETGRLFPAGDRTGLASAVVSLLDDAGDWDRMREEGLRYVRQERNWRVSVERYRPLYARLAGADGG
ncbi:MAG TPA: glycosyltransferase, exosortase A system-associated [Sedimenticola thiotaurini]|uniref:Glycosyltransferase, exosortase A system-associated n=1 Tax=Sedimenticola thiotaurini TaxID=1543721 RepID=A0A831RNN6_9GAMM|nr:glycosyltransferase, exosortase A system-associated [Sedimenticola thiotaurini]